MASTVATPQVITPAKPPMRHVKRKDLLDLDDWKADEITAILEGADAMRPVLDREVKKVPALRGKIIATVFYEVSTRTRISFEEAGKILSADVINMTASGSSVEKGESLLNTGLTLQAMGVDAMVIRHHHPGAAHFLARHLERVSVINAGDGPHAHPTQGLLDLYTARQHLGDLAGRNVVIVGDVLHSRVARSAVWGFAGLGANVVLCGPPALLPDPFTSSGWGPSRNGKHNPLANVQIQPDLDVAIEGADVVMALRIHFERQRLSFFSSEREYIRSWQVDEQRMARANPNALLMHPGPLNEGIEISTSLAHGDRSKIEEQVTNGVAVRMAVLYQLVGSTQEGTIR